MTQETRSGTLLLLATLVLVAIGFTLYLDGRVGWAQTLWVMASGTAGAGIVLVVERR